MKTANIKKTEITALKDEELDQVNDGMSIFFVFMIFLTANIFLYRQKNY